MAKELTDTEKKLQEIVAARLQVEPQDVPLDQSLLGELGLDSFNLMSAILEIEEVFSPISLADKSLEDFNTLRDVAGYIDRERGGG